MDSQRSNSRQHEHQFISLPLSTILFKTHLTSRTYLSLSKHFVACGPENKKKPYKTELARERFLKMFIWVYMHFSFLLIKERWKRWTEFFLTEIMLRSGLFEGFFLFSKAMVHSCQMFHFLCLLIIIMTLIYFVSAKFSQRTQKHEGFFST